MELETAIAGLRCAVHLATFGILASFYDPTARHRPWVSLLAVALAAPSIGYGVWLLFGLIGREPIEALSLPNLLQTFLAASLFIIVAACRGNVARLLPPKNPETHA